MTQTNLGLQITGKPHYATEESNPLLRKGRLTSHEQDALLKTAKNNPDADFARNLIREISAKAAEPKDPYLNERGI